ncbi:thioesterase family protein [Mycobacterium sp. AMU20-3851]|uniref:acyl-CoA thioesterase n=1 Tax=Mycobacterium sp. AMU20-3851 TaxID=3122055 RepID=UPI0037542496
MTVLDNGIALERTGDGVLRGRTVPEWANMVGPFGGITAAALVRAIELQPDVHGLPVALTANYLAPIVDGPFDITARAVRTNRTNQHWYVELSQDGEVKTTATAVFGIRRDTWGDTELVRPSAPAPEDVPAGGPGPTWMNNYDMRYVAGGIPTEADGESASSETLLWLRDNPARPWDFAALAAACDVFYPRVFRRLGRWMPAGTISFTVYFHADTDTLAAQGSDHVLARAQAQQFSAGHFDQSAQLWATDGALLATSHQIVYFKG